MRLLNALNEGEDYMEVLKYIKRDCKPFLKAIEPKPHRNMIYRGYKSIESWFLKTTRADRKPKDIGEGLHNDFDMEFKKRFGYKARSESFFATGEDEEASMYGEVYTIFPVGDFKILWSPKITDLFADMGRIVGDSAKIKKYNGLLDHYKEKGMEDQYQKKISEIVGTYRNDNLKGAIASLNEIMIKCDKYYAVREFSKATGEYKYINGKGFFE